MAFPATIKHTGSLQAAPTNGSLGDVPSLTDLINTSFQATYQSTKSGRPSINAPVVPAVLDLESVVKVRAIALRVRGGSLKILLTSAAGVDQAIRVSDAFIWSAPSPGDEITAIKFVGVADLEYVIAGDTA